MRTVLFFKNAPDHPFGGPILYATKVREIEPYGWHEPHIVIDAPWRPDWDATHFVLDGVETPIPGEIIAARELAMARVRLRVRRNGILRDEVDPIAGSQLRWNALTSEQQAAVAAWRQALLDWPATETDPLNPTPPTPPEL